MPFYLGSNLIRTKDRLANSSGKWSPNLNKAAMQNVTGYHYSTFDNAAITGFHAASNGSGVQIAGTTGAITFTSGKTYKISFVCSAITGTAPIYQPETADPSVGSLLSGATTQTAVAGANNYSFTATQTVTVGSVAFGNVNTTTDYTISDFSVVEALSP